MANSGQRAAPAAPPVAVAPRFGSGASVPKANAVRGQFHFHEDMWEPVLVPVRLTARVDNQRWVNETLLWDVAEPGASPEVVVRQICDDLDLPTIVEGSLLAQFQTQLEAHRRAVRPLVECRVVIKLDLQVAGEVYRDQFEWDAREPSNSVVLFARHLGAELGLSGAMQAAIAHAICEQASAGAAQPPLLTAFREEDWSPTLTRAPS